MAVAGVIEVDFGDFINDLAHQGAGLHVVVGIFEHAANYLGTQSCWTMGCELFF